MKTTSRSAELETTVPLDEISHRNKRSVDDKHGDVRYIRENVFGDNKGIARPVEIGVQKIKSVQSTTAQPVCGGKAPSW